MTTLMITMGLLAALGVGVLAGWFTCAGIRHRETELVADQALRTRFALRSITPALRDLAHSQPLGPLRGRAEAAVLVAERELEGGGPYYRHVRRGSRYEALTTHARLSLSDPRFCVDGAEVALYMDVDNGGVWVRPTVEFLDGRFQQVTEAGRDYDEEGELRELIAGVRTPTDRV